ncbi:hypothetical protein T4B_5041 [Trichinella pseudospiralis]|uniref:Uncharacterized protein n=1 Tax=Trichinella pseudospiralis TaxID=6337 RepID=A0A0V1IIT4_TRIPS|nr:hypothetical protein T4A_2918 [Trichinella pseudospiralis]KRZ22101.1 hypothetical protein T4B_5041 [Trichinella pseudospiralis]KRZ34869.1 hypothetical protein T4C_4061 [Trichinella pseudospiralis]
MHDEATRMLPSKRSKIDILLIILIERFFPKHCRDEDVEFIFKKKSSVSAFSIIAFVYLPAAAAGGTKTV